MRFYVRFKEKCYTAVVEKHAHELRSALNKSEIYIQRVAMLFRQAFFFCRIKRVLWTLCIRKLVLKSKAYCLKKKLDDLLLMMSE